MLAYQFDDLPSDEETIFDDGEGVLLPARPAEYAFRSDDRVQLHDEIAHALLASHPLKRLADIGFLGAIEYSRKGSGRSAHRRKHNRLEHSIGVALLAQRFAMRAEIPHRDRLTLICAALLHDVGHGPLSHSLEPVFDDHFKIDHHRATRNLIKGDTRYGTELLDIIRSYNVDPEYVLAYIDAENDGPYGHLFSGRINLDTLEAITRCRAFVGPTPATGTALRAVDLWAQSVSLPQDIFDDFWSLKHSIYAGLINSPMGHLLDTIAQAWATANISRLKPEDFFLTETQFRRSHPGIFKLIRQVAGTRHGIYDVLPSDWLHIEVQARRREYYVDSSVELLSVSDIDRRYQQKKKCWVIALEDFLTRTFV